MADEQYIKSVSSHFVLKSYDEFDGDIMIMPYSTNTYTNYSSKYNISPCLWIEKGGVCILILSFGFTEDDWIFMDKITVDCDGTQIEYDVDYSNRSTHVNWGNGVTEICAKAHSAEVKTNNAEDFSKLIEAMDGAKTIKIRFSGSDGYYDYTLSQSEVDNVLIYWKVNNILERNPDLSTLVIG